jgi:hypothetical protein
MRAKLIRALLLVAAAAAVAVALALAAAPHEPSEAGSRPLWMPAQTGRSVVQLHPAPGRPESSPQPVVRVPAVPAASRRPAVPASPPRRPRTRIVIVPGVILTRVEPDEPAVEVIPVKPRRTRPVPTTRELAEAGEAELVHDPPAPPRPHE